jgi:hypothetical protein
VVKIADSGAATIRALLEEPSVALGGAVEALGAGLVGTERSGGTVPPSTGQAIGKLQTFYGNLMRRVERVDTSNGQGKRLALSGLASMMSGLSRFEEGIAVGAAEDQAQKALGEAWADLRRGAEGIERAEAEL